MWLMWCLFGLIDINALKIAENYFDYFAGVNIDNPSKRHINMLVILAIKKAVEQFKERLDGPTPPILIHHICVGP